MRPKLRCLIIMHSAMFNKNPILQQTPMPTVMHGYGGVIWSCFAATEPEIFLVNDKLYFVLENP